MFYDDLNTEEQVSYLIKPILQVLQEAGGQLERSEIRDRISELDEHIAEFEQKLYTSNKTGNQYKKFDFKFNFAIKELSYVGLISYVKFNPKITLTQDGANVDLTDFDVKTEVRDKARSYWEEHSTKNKSKNKPVETLEVEDEENESTDDELLDDFKVKRYYFYHYAKVRGGSRSVIRTPQHCGYGRRSTPWTIRTDRNRGR